MNAFFAAFYAEALKARRSRMPLFTAAGFSLAPLVGGLFMIILKNPEQARALGLISLKAQLVGGVADWPTYFSIVSQGIAVGGAVVFALITAWVFGREFSDHTAKELLALPAPRGAIVAAKFALTALWILGLAVMAFGLGLVVATAVDLPGWSAELQWASFGTLLLIAIVSFMLVPFIALFASAGRGYLPALGWAFLTVALAQIIVVLGWGDWFPWAVPALVSGMAGPRAELLGLHSYIVVGLAFLGGAAATFAWWQRADHDR